MIRSARLPLIATVLVCAFTLATPAVAADGASQQPLTDSAQRPRALVPLYASFVALQVVDMHSTWRALDHGSVEANPLLNGVAGNRAALFTAKAAGTAAVVAVSERLRKKSPTAALVLMIAANSGMTWVVQHNYRTVP
jgi:uncharacterized protein DUF5658